MEFKIISEQLPAIAFNFEELKTALSGTMDKYKGIVVTEDTLQDCKTTQRELAGIRNRIDTYRKDKKKELSKPIAEFESKCKELIGLVEQAEQPIKNGIQLFDDKRREEKKQTAQLIINHTVLKFELNEKYASQLTMIDKYMNLTASAKEVTEDVETRALLLKEQQNQELEMLEIIKGTIENANKGINAKLSLKDFQMLINRGISTKDIIQEINARAERIRIAELPKEEEPTQPEPTPVKQEELKQPEPAKEEKLYYVEIRIVGTRNDTARLGQYLRDNNYNYKVLGKGIVE